MSSAFSRITKEARAPGKTLVLEPWVFADEWNGKPHDSVCVGLRLMPEAEKSKARSEAERLAGELHPRGGPNWIDAFNDAIMRQVCALGMCSPNDVTRPTELLPFAEEQVRFALTSKGVAFVFEAIDRYEIETSPIGAEAEQGDLQHLAEVLVEQDVSQLRPGLRRLLRYVLEELGEVDDGS